MRADTRLLAIKRDGKGSCTRPLTGNKAIIDSKRGGTGVLITAAPGRAQSANRARAIIDAAGAAIKLPLNYCARGAAQITVPVTTVAGAGRQDARTRYSIAHSAPRRARADTRRVDDDRARTSSWIRV